jgi:hypothetical protein
MLIGWFFAEGDLLPSLIVMFTHRVLVLQTLSQGTEAIKSLLVEVLVDEARSARDHREKRCERAKVGRS